MSTVFLRCSLGDISVSDAFLRMPVRGNWSGVLEMGSPAAPAQGEPATLVYQRENGTADMFVGTIRRVGSVPGTQTVKLTLVGGAGKLLNAVPARDHIVGPTSLPAGLVARSIVDAAGEKLSRGVEVALDSLQLPRWTRISSTARDALDLLVDRLGLGWRVMLDGTIWVGAETWPAVNGVAFYTDQDPDDGLVMYASDGARLLPGTTIDGVRALAVEYTITPGSIRAQVRSEVAGDPPRASDYSLYQQSYPATVVKQNDNGTIDVVADDLRVGSVLSLGVRVGIPGAAVTVPEGARLRVAFDAADPQRTYATALDQDPAATHAIALVGDAIDCGFLTGISPPSGGPVALSLSPISTDPVNEVHLVGRVAGPGHKYAKGVSA